MNDDRALAQISEAERALIEARDLASILEIRDRAKAMASYARAKKAGDVANVAKELQLRAERSAGDFLAAMDKAKGGQPYQSTPSIVEGVDRPPPLAELGIGYTQSHRWQAIAGLPSEQFEGYIAQAKEAGTELTAAGLYRIAQTPELPHVAHNSGNNEWYTPPEYIKAARQVMGGIDLDPASSEIANRTIGATEYYTVADDGLAWDWYGRVWMNPPYASNLIGDFCSKLAMHIKLGHVIEACVLVNNATETAWFNALLDLAACACFIRGRVRFIDAQGNPSGAPLQGQAILYFGPNVTTFGNVFSAFGTVLYARRDP